MTLVRQKKGPEGRVAPETEHHCWSRFFCPENLNCPSKRGLRESSLRVSQILGVDRL